MAGVTLLTGVPHLISMLHSLPTAGIIAFILKIYCMRMYFFGMLVSPLFFFVHIDQCLNFLIFNFTYNFFFFVFYVTLYVIITGFFVFLHLQSLS
jgi:hypothetical protein